MSFKATIQVTNNRLVILDKTLRRNAAKVCQAAALHCEGVAKTHAPIDTGFLLSSIQAQEESELSWLVNCGADYGIYQEWGTSVMAPHPFMTPAAEATKPEFISNMKKALDE